jgi:hypothetical protein
MIQELNHLQGNTVPQSCRTVSQPQEVILFPHPEFFLCSIAQEMDGEKVDQNNDGGVPAEFIWQLLKCGGLCV